MKSKLIGSNKFLQVEEKIKQYLNSFEKAELGITGSARTTGDKIPLILSDVLESYLNGLSQKFILNIGSKSMANFEFMDKQNFHYFINVVTHNMDSGMSRPNLTSVDRLINLYLNNMNYFIILMVHYHKTRKSNYISSVKFSPIEHFSINCLGFGALGTGQIQIIKASQIDYKPQNRISWMIEFAEKLGEFYSKENQKSAIRLTKAIKLKNDWRNKISHS